jgi:hypothetical protein
MDDIFRRVEEHLRRMLPPRKRNMPITPETELYGDLGFYGDVLAFDVIGWASREFGIQGAFRLDDYARSEMPGFLRPLAKLIGRNRGSYKSLKVRDLVRAIESKRWPE